jgi:hypothetical protein
VGYAAVLKLQWERRDMHTGFWREDPKERDHLEDLGVDGRIILKFVFKELGHEGMDWVCLAQDTDQ